MSRVWGLDLGHSQGRKKKGAILPNKVTLEK